MAEQSLQLLRCRQSLVSLPAQDDHAHQFAEGLVISLWVKEAQASPRFDEPLGEHPGERGFSRAGRAHRRAHSRHGQGWSRAFRRESLPGGAGGAEAMREKQIQVVQHMLFNELDDTAGTRCARLT